MSERFGQALFQIQQQAMTAGMNSTSGPKPALAQWLKFMVPIVRQ